MVDCLCIVQSKWRVVSLIINRFFTCFPDGTIRYSQGEDSLNVRGEIPFVIIRGLGTEEAAANVKWPTKETDKCVAIECHGRTYFATAETNVEAFKWKLVIVRNLMELGTKSQVCDGPVARKLMI